ncbi:hypothetical protein ACI68E_003272 [Malassezia pachydermatis]|uniref:Uncharacterized protein n=1 Tax=Malassezia pachydermatis TaxID=77020 RepID=A0A0M8MTW0_9BASI|nr:hypothetical protein Malapachy_4105 [Malassezia pachydermatis]KOS14244.1 hypothetical protein Malapachy_4105 [Malassezia pachydermatis]
MGGGNDPTRRGWGDDVRAMLEGQGKQAGQASTSHSAMESTFAGPSRTSSSAAAFRSHAATSSQGDVEFAQFHQGTHPSNANPAFMEQAWQQSVPSASTAPSASATQDYAAAQRDGDAFMAALMAEEATGRPNDDVVTVTPASVAPVVGLVEEWRPPSPSQGDQMTREQYLLHVHLAEVQTGVSHEQPYRQAEGVEPPPDDARLAEGVYAPTAEQALETVLDTQGTREARVQEFRTTTEGSVPTSAYTQIRGQAIVDRLRGWLVREGFTDEVYGLPPLVAKTFGEATASSEDQQTEERRATAIRRLDALYKHLSLSPAGSRSGAAEMEAWLQSNGS